MFNIGIDGPGCSCDGEGCSLCAALDESCEACGAVLADANRGDGIGDLCATCFAAGSLDGVRTYVGFDANLFVVGERPPEYPGRQVARVDRRTGHIWLMPIPQITTAENEVSL